MNQWQEPQRYLCVLNRQTEISPLFCKKAKTHKISILQEKQESGSLLHMTNISRCSIPPPPPILVTLEGAVVIFLHNIDQWYSTFFVRVPPDTISLQLCTPKVVGA
jgi:hypothetical protein